jgi:carbohydrate diacid regulator
MKKYSIRLVKLRRKKMASLTEFLAQSIVDKVMEVIPYNINIMNSDGVIIGSGDKERIGQLHEGAEEAIKKNQLIKVYEVKGGAKPGVNIPIYFNNNIMGVIGISGNPEIVMAFASIVKVTAELLINQQYLFDERRIKEQIREEFLYQWTYLGQYDDAFIERAKTLSIDLDIERIAIVISGKSDRNIIYQIKRYLYENEYVIALNSETLLLFMKMDLKLNKRIHLLYENMKDIKKIGVGLLTSAMSQSVKQALKAIEIAEKLNILDIIVRYDRIEFIDILSKASDRKVLSSIVNKLEEAKGQELVKTVLNYVVLNGEVNNVAEALHIHRNTLSYRLKKVEELTGKSPRNIIDLMELFTACIL